MCIMVSVVDRYKHCRKEKRKRNRERNIKEEKRQKGRGLDKRRKGNATYSMRESFHAEREKTRYKKEERKKERKI